MWLAFYLFLSLTSFAGEKAVKAWPLQVQCGLQSLRSNGYLAYGTLVYQPVPYRLGQEPALAYFHSYQLRNSLHPFCETIKSAIAQSQFLTVELGGEREIRTLETLESAN